MYLMKFLGRCVLPFVLFGCSKIAQTAMDGFNDAVNGRPGKHLQDVHVKNTGTQSLTFMAEIGRPGDDCTPDMDRKEITLQSGEEADLHVEQVCRGRRRAWWGVNLAKSYNSGYVSASYPQTFAKLSLGTQFHYGNRDKNIRIAATVVAEKTRLRPIPLSRPEVDQAGVAWISKEDFISADATAWALYLAIPKQFDTEDLYVYFDQDWTTVLDMDDPGAVNPSPVYRNNGVFVGLEALSGAITVDCTEDGCLVL